MTEVKRPWSRQWLGLTAPSEHNIVKMILGDVDGVASVDLRSITHSAVIVGGRFGFDHVDVVNMLMLCPTGCAKKCVDAKILHQMGILTLHVR